MLEFSKTSEGHMKVSKPVENVFVFGARSWRLKLEQFHRVRHFGSKRNGGKRCNQVKSV